MEDLFPITISKKNQPSTCALDLEEVLWTQPSLQLLRNTTVIKKYAENVMQLFHLKLPTVERENVDIAIKLDLKKNQRIDR
jgi:hypothetical protein